MIYIPGFGESCHRYGYFFENLARNGIDVYAKDRRGFGLSEGARGRLIKEETISDMLEFLETIPRDVPTFLFGYSMGGLIANHLTYKIGGLDI